MVSRASNLVFDNAVLRQHPFYGAYHKSLHDISKKDYPNDSYFRTDVDGIDLDQYEIDRAIANRDMTMDAVIGVADYANNRVVNSRLLLVELRMDYDSTKGLHHSSLHGKITHSRAAIGTSVRVDEENVFVFRKDVAEQAKKWMFGTAKEYSEAEKWVAVSTDELDNLLQSQADMPYQPETDMSQSDADMVNKIAAKDFDGLLEHIAYWDSRAEGFRVQYKHQEESHIKNHLHDAWQQIKTKGNNLTMEQQAYVDVIEDEYRYLK